MIVLAIFSFLVFLLCIVKIKELEERIEDLEGLPEEENIFERPIA